MRSEAGNLWRAQLGLWAIPQEILDQAPEDPWIHPPALFQIPDVIIDSPSHARAREVLYEGAAVLDIGCGGGIAAFALVPPATRVIGVDHQDEMLEMFSVNARNRGVDSQIFEGFWPEVATNVPVADVAVAHHVLYNVPDVEDFLIAMSEHASKRAMLELPLKHPLSVAAPLWKHFWNLERPTQPSPELLLEVLQEIGFKPHIEVWKGEMRREGDLEKLTEYSRIRLCLPASRDAEIFEFLQSQPPVTERELATIWWDCH